MSWFIGTWVVLLILFMCAVTVRYVNRTETPLPFNQNPRPTFEAPPPPPAPPPAGGSSVNRS